MLRGLTMLCGCALLVLSMPSGARAYEDQITLGFGLGYSNLFMKDMPPDDSPPPEQGLIVDGSVSYGLNTAWSLRGRLSYALNPGDEPLHVGVAAAEVLYLIDVVEVVPYFGLGAGALARLRNGDGDVVPAVHAVVGFDYLLSRTVALGVDVRAHLLPTELDSAPVYLAALGTMTFMFNR